MSMFKIKKDFIFCAMLFGAIFGNTETNTRVFADSKKESLLSESNFKFDVRKANDDDDVVNGSINILKTGFKYNTTNNKYEFQGIKEAFNDAGKFNVDFSNIVFSLGYKNFKAEMKINKKFTKNLLPGKEFNEYKIPTLKWEIVEEEKKDEAVEDKKVANVKISSTDENTVEEIKIGEAAVKLTGDLDLANMRCKMSDLKIFKKTIISPLIDFFSLLNSTTSITIGKVNIDVDLNSPHTESELRLGGGYFNICNISVKHTWDLFHTNIIGLDLKFLNRICLYDTASKPTKQDSQWYRLYRMWYANIVNISSGNWSCDLSIFNTKILDVKNNYSNLEGKVNDIKHFSIFFKHSKKDLKGILESYSVEATALFIIGKNEDVPCVILARNPEDFANIYSKPEKVYNPYKVNAVNNFFARIPIYINGTASWKKWEFFGEKNSHVKLSITSEMCLSYNSQGHVKDGKLSNFENDKNATWVPNIYCVPINLKIEIFRGGYFVLNITAFEIDNNNNEGFFHRKTWGMMPNLNISFILNKLYNDLFGEENIDAGIDM